MHKPTKQISLRPLAIMLLFLALQVMLTPFRSWGQVNILFVPEAYGRFIDGLGNFQVQNLTGVTVKGQVVISVHENISKTQVVTITCPPVTFNPGNSTFPATAYAGSTFNFTSSKLANIVSQTRNFPPGEYTYCYSFVAAGHDENENCFDANIQPLVPISLINPSDGDKICQKRPSLSWQPPVPYPPSMRFRLELVQKTQSAAVESMLMNAPLVFLDNIPTTTISYPSFAPDLVEGNTYAWQVIAYQDGVVMSTSDIWTFTVQCTDSVQAAPNDSYRELQSLMNGHYYIATGTLKFSLINSYNVKKLDYEIYSTDEGNKKISNLPDIPLIRGLNKIDVDLSEMDLIDGNHYILKVYPFNEQEVSVRFIYKETSSTN